MKKYLVYIIPALMAIAILLLFFTGNNMKSKKADHRVTLRQQDKVPYGTYLAFKNLQYLFPGASIATNRREPGKWDSISKDGSNQALIIITGQFNAEEEEMEELLSFIEKGNSVFISARSISWSTYQALECRVEPTDLEDNLSGIVPGDSLHLFLNEPTFLSEKGFYYSGKILDATFKEIKHSITQILGEDEKGRPDFVRMRAGNGNLFVHLAPLAFTNHFLLYKNNIEYYEDVLSVIPAGTEKIVWDEYYLNKKYLEDEQKKKGWFDVLSKYPGLKPGLITVILTLLLYVLLEMRRKQRYIPVVAKPRNDSLDFVKTIGRLYYDRANHLNLCRKMIAYFLEHVRNKYQVQTSMLDEDFIRNLQYKSGSSETEIREIVTFIKHIETAEDVTDKHLAGFHKQLENFYKKN